MEEGRMRRAPEVVVAEVDGVSRLLNVRTWTYLSLNPTALYVWDQVAQPCSRADLLRSLAEEFDAPLEVLSADLAAFLRQLHELGFLQADQ
jgi:hypothetical protein